MSASTELIALVVTVVGVGVAAQVLSDWLSVPSVLFWLAAGVAVGPEGLGLITPSAIDSGSLSAIVGLSVAIIVFEGAFALKIDRLRKAPRETLRLVTFGAIVSHLGTAVVVRFALGTSWELALLIGSLLIATGPTVITPILEVVPVRERVATTLETEGVVNDVTAAILSIVMFEYLLLEGEGLPTLIGQFAYRLGAGVLVGVAVAGLVWFLLARLELPTENAPRNARLVVLAAALLSYGVAEAGLGVAESGIAAVASAGFLLGNVELPYREQIEQFKGDVTLVVLTFVFVVLASLLSLSDLRSLGVGGIAVVLAVALVIRPLLVFLSTVGERFTFRERLFVSAIGPRGIIPASVVTLFALQLGDSQPEVATTLVGTVFLVIFVTVAFQGGLARHIAQALDVIPMRTIVVGGGRIGQALADRLEDRGEEVTIVELDQDVVETLREDGYRVKHGDGTDRDVLRSAGAENAKVVAAATPSDDVNLLVGQLARNTYDVRTVVARVNQPDNEAAFQDLDIEAISTGMSVAWSMDNVIERPAIARWMTELDRTGDVQEIEVTADDAAGRTVADLTEDLPEDCYVGLISRDDENRIPHAEDRIERGDHVTFIGRKEAVRDAIDFCTA
ncbi:cation:proton antiporter [Halorientalis pallida]|uniref:Potassium transporter n=1 Tax=Halorientalis pallida TaxID=2479928 RepID=A0A498KZV1_9EURY|nr:cation:proton antiporter [Halorientalis pallida]RXK51548.1 potassium transporter [Halorientalis pallida]